MTSASTRCGDAEWLKWTGLGNSPQVKPFMARTAQRQRILNNKIHNESGGASVNLLRASQSRRRFPGGLNPRAAHRTSRNTTAENLLPFSHNQHQPKKQQRHQPRAQESPYRCLAHTLTPFPGLTPKTFLRFRPPLPSFQEKPPSIAAAAATHISPPFNFLAGPLHCWILRLYFSCQSKSSAKLR